MLSNPQCPTCGQYRVRTKAQNNRYWALIREASERMGLDAEALHYWFRKKYLPMREAKYIDNTSELIPISTSRMNQKDWNIYTQKVEVFLAEKGVYLEE